MKTEYTDLLKQIQRVQNTPNALKVSDLDKKTHNYLRYTLKLLKKDHLHRLSLTQRGLNRIFYEKPYRYTTYKRLTFVRQNNGLSAKEYANNFNILREQFYMFAKEHNIKRINGKYYINHTHHKDEKVKQ